MPDTGSVPLQDLHHHARLERVLLFALAVVIAYAAARLSRAAGAVDALRAPEGPRQPADGDADRAGHSRRSDQCRPGRRQQGRALRHAGRRLVSRRSRDAALFHRDRRQRAAGPPLSRCAGEPAVLSRPARGSRVRKARRPQRRPPPSCALLESAGPGPGAAAGLAGSRDLSTAASASATIPAPSPTISARTSTPNENCSPPTWKRRAWWTPNIR